MNTEILFLITCLCIIVFLIFLLWKDSKQLNQAQQKNTDNTQQIASLEMSRQAGEEKLQIVQQQIQDKEKFEKYMIAQFDSLSQKILNKKTSQFKKDSKEQLENTLQPLREQIKLFQEKAEGYYNTGSKEMLTLKNEIKNLMNVSQKMNSEAHNLTQALKGNVKTQGIWGESILSQVLEASGLRENEEYIIQGKELKLKSESGYALKPDVIVKLPQNRHLVIDAKVSLTHYERYISSSNIEEKTELLKSFTRSIRNHISNLSSKEYQNASALNSLDFVFLFFPLESAFSVALQADRSIIESSWKESVVIVSPTTLLATLRTVAFMWQRERENKNVLEIAKKSGDLYDKFVGCLEDLKQVGEHLERSSNSYEEAYKKLSTGKGNIISRLEHIRRLGARTEKQINKELISDMEQ